MSDVIAREGDVLVVTYPEVKVPIKQFWIVGVGNLTYTRRMNAGESVTQQANQIMGKLTELAEMHANERIAKWSEQANPDAPPKPIPPSAQPPRAVGEKPVSARQVAR